MAQWSRRLWCWHGTWSVIRAWRDKSVKSPTEALMDKLIRDIKEDCRGRHWPLRLAMVGWFLFMLAHHLQSHEYQSFLGGLNLGIHEFGHLICMPLGEFVGVAGGSLVQCLVPLASFFMFWRQRDFFAFSFSSVWLGSNLVGVARYMSDARALQLPLVSPFGGGGETIHDWNYILHRLDCLHLDTTLAAIVRVGGLALMGLGIVWGAWIIKHMIAAGPRKIGDQWDAAGLNK